MDLPRRRTLNTSPSYAETLLVIIDMQKAFQLDGAQWQCPGYDSAATQVKQLRAAHPGPAVWTQFVRDPHEEGAWQDYYDKWHQYRIKPNDPMWHLTLEPEPQDTLIKAPTFGKWTTELPKIANEYQHITVAGVATDYCVLSTVLPAVDAGKYVTVVSDACAGATQQAHEQALKLMGMLEPMVTITTTDELLGSR